MLDSLVVEAILTCVEAGLWRFDSNDAYARIACVRGHFWDKTNC